MKKFVSILMALVMILSLAACGGDPATSGSGSGVGGEDSKYGGELNVRWNTLEKGLDPHIFSGWGFYHWALCVFENPISQDENGNFAPGVCEFELSEDQTVLKLWVREGKKVHDGTDVEIEDVVASLDRASLQSSIDKYFTQYIDSVEVKDGVATYTFKEFVANTLYYMTGYFTYCSVMPKEICEKYGKDLEKAINTVEDCIGTGPYKVVEYVEDTHVIMDKFADYVTLEGSSGPAVKYGYMDRITVHCNKDNTSAQMALFAGEYDICRLAGEEYIAMADQQGFVKLDDRSANNVYIAFNTKGDRPVADKNLRKAIAALINDTDVIPNLRTSYIMEHCPIQGLYYTDKFNQADYYATPGVETARKYLAQSSYNGEELVFLIGGTSGEPYALTLKDKGKQVGINVRLEYVDSGVVKSMYSDPKTEFDMVYLTSAVGSYVPGTLAANLRTTFWGDERGLELLTETAATPYGSEESLAAWDELSDLMIEECPYTVLCWGTSVWARNPDVNDNVPANSTYNYWYNAYWEN